jgi:YVTN family beta-propeller protein
MRSIDTGLGEQCDGSATGCQVGETCNDACQCQPTRADKSSPIEVTADGRKVVAVNTDTNTASFFQIGDDKLLTKLQEVAVGKEPRSVATLVSKPWAYIANTVSGTVSVIDTENYTTVATVDVGTEPQALVASPNGRFVYVALANDNAVKVIDTNTNGVIATIPVGRALARSPSPTTATRTTWTRRCTCRTSSPVRGRDSSAEQRQPGRERQRPSGPEPRGSRSSARASSMIPARLWSTSSRPRPTRWSAM